MTRIVEQLDAAIAAAIASVIGAITASVVWIVRRVFTNEKKVDILEAEARSREEFRRREHETMSKDLHSVRESVDRLHETIVDVLKESKR